MILHLFAIKSMSSIQTIEDAVLQFQQEQFPKAQCLIISGSQIDGSSNKYSDVDVLIFLLETISVYQEVMEYENLMIQSIIIPIKHVEELLWVDLSTRTGPFIDMFSKGKILLDTNGYSERLINHCKILRKNGPLPLTFKENGLLRIKISNLLNDLRGNNQKDQLFYTVLSIADNLSKLILLSNRDWCGEGKHRFKTLNNNFPDIQVKLEGSLHQYFLERDTKPLESFTTNVLNQLGGEISSYSQNFYKNYISENYFCIEIANLGEPEDLLKRNKVITDFLKKYNQLKFYSLILKPIGKNKIDGNLYFVIHGPNEILNHEILGKLDILLNKNPLFPKYQYPIHFDPILKFSNSKEYFQILPILIELNKVKLRNNYLGFKFKLKAGILLIDVIEELFFKNKKTSYLEFLEYSFSLSFIDSLDYSTRTAVKNIEKQKTDLLEKYENEFEKNNILINDIFRNSQLRKEIKSCFPDQYQLPEENVYKIYFSKNVPPKWMFLNELLLRQLSILLIDFKRMSFIIYVMKNHQRRANFSNL